MTGCDCQGPCTTIVRINDPWRDVTVVNDRANNKNCDKEGFHPEQWYSFYLDNQAAMVPTTCVQSHHCGTTISMRIELEGQAMPESGEYVNASLCGSYNILGSYDCCVLRSPVTIFRCKNNEIVYKFHSPIDRCPAAICTQKIHDQVPKQVIALMGDPHPDRLNSTAPNNDEGASDDESGPENPPEDIMIQEDENPLGISNDTQQQRATNDTQDPSMITSDSNPPQQIESNNTSNGNDTTSIDIVTSEITTTTAPETSATPTTPNQATTSSTGQTPDTWTSTTSTTEKAENPTSTSVQDTTSKDLGSPLPISTNTTAETAQITNKNNTSAVNTTTTTTKDGNQTDGLESLNTTTPISSSRLESSPPSSSPTAPTSPIPLVSSSSSPSTTTIASSTSASSSPPVSTSTSTPTVARMTTTPITSTMMTTTTASVTSASSTIPSTSSLPSSTASSSTSQTTTLSSSTSASSYSPPSTVSTDSEFSVSSSPSPTSLSPSTTQSQSHSIATSSPATQSQSSSASKPTRATQPPSSDVTTQFPQPSTHEVVVIELVRFVFLGGFWDGNFSQHVMMLLNYFLNEEMAIRKVEEPSSDPWFEITRGETVVEDRNETTHVDTRIAHAGPEQLLYLFQTTDFADYLFEEGNLSLLVACRPSRLCQMDDDYTYTIAPPNPSHKTPQKSSTFEKNLPVLIAVTTICAFCLIVMATGVVCAKCRKKRRSWNAGSEAEKRALKDNRSNCQGTPSPFTDTQIMSDEEAADGSANGSALDGGETLQDNSWVVPLEYIELDEIDKEVVAETTEDTKF